MRHSSSSSVVQDNNHNNSVMMMSVPARSTDDSIPTTQLYPLSSSSSSHHPPYEGNHHPHHDRDVMMVMTMSSSGQEETGRSSFSSSSTSEAGLEAGGGGRGRTRRHFRQVVEYHSVDGAGGGGGPSISSDPLDRPPRRSYLQTLRLLRRVPLLAYVPHFRDLAAVFGGPRILMFLLTSFLSKGMTSHFLSGSALPFFRDELGVRDVVTYQTYLSIGVLGWSLKPIMGIISDSVLIYGFRKKYYMLGAATLATCSLVCYAQLGPSQVYLAVLLYFLLNSTCALLDLLPEGIYSELIRWKPSHASSMVSYVWVLIMVGGALAAVMQGPLADAGKSRVTLLIAACCQCALIFPLKWNWFGEKRVRCLAAATLQDPVSEPPADGGGDSQAECRHALASGGNNNKKRKTKNQKHRRRNLQSVPNSTAGVGAAVDESPEEQRSEVEVEDPPSVPRSPAPLFSLTHRLYEDRRTYLLCLFACAMTCGTLLLAWVSLTQSKVTLFFVSVTVVLILFAVAVQTLPSMVARASIFMFMKELCYVQLQGPLDYFYTAPATCLPDGPQFSYWYYQTFTVVVGYLAGMLGVHIFHRFVGPSSSSHAPAPPSSDSGPQDDDRQTNDGGSHLSPHDATTSSSLPLPPPPSSSPPDLRRVFVVTTIVKVAASLIDLMIIRRWNRSVFGLSDHFAYLAGDAVVLQACQMIDFIPPAILISQLCPKGLEATMYAILAGFSNFGVALSTTTGGLLSQFLFPIHGSEIKHTLLNATTTLAPTTTSSPNWSSSSGAMGINGCDFSNLFSLVLVGHCVTPWMVIALTYALLPKGAKLGEFSASSESNRRST